ncbi:MAG TPA: DUF559 domain-containing protein, partial [Gemmataceae bacterium]|nr:DUF559 domain-containing protein [Gemmataceae bacterium]
MLCGPVGLAVVAWRRWAADRGRSGVQTADTDLRTVVTRWVAAVARGRDLTRDALSLLASDSGRSLPEPDAFRAARTLRDVEQLWDGLTPDPARAAARRAGRFLLRQWVAGVPVDTDSLAGQLDTALASQDGPWARVVEALGQLVPRHDLPCLLLAPADPSPSAVWVDSAARVLARLVTLLPGFPAALAAPADVVACYLGAAQESHAKALVREGVVALPGLRAEQIGERLRSLSVDVGGLAEPIRRLAADGASEELVASFGEAARQFAEPAAGEEAEDRARSAAERFLFERLESLPQTAGQFVLNATLDFRFGVKEAEVDLLAKGLRLALEVDGYHHFRDADAYRRDRRKDWELQRRGYVVLRFLADDVVSRMEE